jgi:hypothetical protein
MKKPILIIAAVLSILLAAGIAYAYNAYCDGYAYYDGSPAVNCNVNVYNWSSMELINTIKPGVSGYFRHDGFQGDRYFICIMDAQGHWYHAGSVYPTGDGTHLGVCNLSSSVHQGHPAGRD